MVVDVPEQEGGRVAHHAAVEQAPQLRVRLGAHQPDVEPSDDDGGQPVYGLRMGEGRQVSRRPRRGVGVGGSCCGRKGN